MVHSAKIFPKKQSIGSTQFLPCIKGPETNANKRPRNREDLQTMANRRESLKQAEQMRKIPQIPKYHLIMTSTPVAPQMSSQNGTRHSHKGEPDV